MKICQIKFYSNRQLKGELIFYTHEFFQVKRIYTQSIEEESHNGTHIIRFFAGKNTTWCRKLPKILKLNEEIEWHSTDKIKGKLKDVRLYLDDSYIVLELLIQRG